MSTKARSQEIHLPKLTNVQQGKIVISSEIQDLLRSFLVHLMLSRSFLCPWVLLHFRHTMLSHELPLEQQLNLYSLTTCQLKLCQLYLIHKRERVND